jgi:hypothetical protein
MGVAEWEVIDCRSHFLGRPKDSESAQGAISYGGFSQRHQQCWLLRSPFCVDRVLSLTAKALNRH